MQSAQFDALSRIDQGQMGDADLMRLPESMRKDFQGRMVRLPQTQDAKGNAVPGRIVFASTPDDAKEVKEVQTGVQQLRKVIEEMRQLKKASGAELSTGLPGSTDAEDAADGLQQRAFTIFRSINAKSGRPGEYSDKALGKMFPIVTEWDQGGVEQALGQGEAMAESMLQSAYETRLGGKTSTGNQEAFAGFKKGLRGK